MRIAIRVDASRASGSGHFMRCLTLADGLARSGARARFLSRHLPDHLCSLLQQRGYEFVRLTGGENEPMDELVHAAWLGTSQEADARATRQALADRAWDWAVVDHYALDVRWEQAVRPVVGRMFVIDDLADRQHDCSVLLDQNHYADLETRYRGKVPDGCDLLLGPRYALLRDEFQLLREQVRPRTGPVSRTLVSFGGVDADNYTTQALEAISGLAAPHLRVDAVIGAEHPERRRIQTVCDAQGFTCHLQTDRIAELMAAADLAVGAGGLGLWERCCLGLPSIVVAIADNQVRQVRDAAGEAWIYAPALPAAGGRLSAALAQHVAALRDNEELRHAMSRLGMRAVDGRGVSRVMRRLGSVDLQLREANAGDTDSLFTWRNHPAVRQASRNKAPLDRESHGRWVASVLSDQRRALLIGERAGAPVGVVRFDIGGDEAEVSIYLVPDRPFRGAGGDLLLAAEQWLMTSRPGVRRLRAHVLGDNRRSHGLFTASGYGLDGAWYSKELVQR